MLKFFWKIFFTAMIISTLSVAMSGYILINSGSKIILQNEIQSNYDMGDIVYNYLSNEIENTMVYNSFTNQTDVLEAINDIAQSVNINYSKGKIKFAIINENAQTVFSSLNHDFDKEIIFSLEDNQKGYSLRKISDNVYIQTIRPAKLQDRNCYIETLSDISFIFENQNVQYQTLLKIMIVMFLCVGLLTFFISHILMRQVVLLASTTKKISAGNLSKRVPINGYDEFAELSQNFNDMADALEEKMEELKIESEKNEMFVGAFSHELKTPLTSIIGYSDMLRSKRMNEEKTALCANYIFKEGKRLEKLSMRLLDLIVIKNQEINPVETHMEIFFQEVQSVIVPKLMKKDIRFYVNIESAVVLMEPELMKTVFLNLLDNAIKAIDNTGDIAISGEKQEEDYIVTIKDNGKGMNAEDLKKIKQAFYMVDKSRSRKQGGAGLGLAICDMILQLHGFEISFKSKEGTGTIVMVKMKGAENE